MASGKCEAQVWPRNRGGDYQGRVLSIKLSLSLSVYYISIFSLSLGLCRLLSEMGLLGNT